MTALNEPASVSVIVPHYNDLARLALCLEALEHQTYPRGRTEIIVGDNASPQGPEAVAAVLAGRARLVNVPERGAGPARNGGAALATGDILAFIDADCVPEPLWLEEGVRALRDFDIVGGRVRVTVDDEARMTPAEAFERVFAFDNETYVRRKGFTVSANLLCSRAVFQAVGGFDVGVSEDIDWCHRARVQGWRLGYAPAAAIGHPARRNWTELQTKWRRVNAETYRLATRARGGRALWLSRCVALPLSAIAHAPKALTSGALNSAAQRWSAAVMLFRHRLWRCWDGLGLLLRDGKAA